MIGFTFQYHGKTYMVIEELENYYRCYIKETQDTYDFKKAWMKRKYARVKNAEAEANGTRKKWVRDRHVNQLQAA